MTKDDVIFYATKTGNIGTSFDDENVINHLGRRMPINSAWEEIDADWDDLADECKAATLAEIEKAARIKANIETAKQDAIKRRAKENEEARRFLVDMSPLFNRLSNTLGRIADGMEKK